MLKCVSDHSGKRFSDLDCKDVQKEAFCVRFGQLDINA